MKITPRKGRASWKSLFAAVMCLALGGEVTAQTAVDGPAARRMSRYSVVWTSPSKDAAGVMPIGNGDIAAGVYAIENGDSHLLLAKNDAFSYCGDLYKTGRVRISMTPNPFTAGKSFRQTLDLPTGSIRIEADGVKLRIWADANRPLYHVEVESPRELVLSAQPEFWKRYTQWKGPDNTPDVKLTRGNRVLWYFHVGDKSFYPEEMRMSYQLKNPETILPDPYRFNTFGNSMEGPGLAAADGVLSGRGRTFDLRIHALTVQTRDPRTVWVKAIEALAEKPVELAADWARHRAWWADFWDRSWIIASDRTVPADQREKLKSEADAKGMRDEPDGAALVAQSYNFFRFAMAAQSRGRIQVKFNGGLFTQQTRATKAPQYPAGDLQQADGSWISSPDARAWGRRFTFQNQRLLYWPLLMSGDADLMKPFFDHYWNTLAMRKAITRHSFGHEGAFYRENVMPLTGSCHDCGTLPKTKPGEKYNGGYHDYYFTSGLETVAMMADYVNYTGDVKFRHERLVPFAREILLFYDKHYLRGPDGKLRLDPSQAIETWWIAVNPATDVAGLRFCLDQLLAMRAGTAGDQKNWKKFRAEMPEVPMRTVDGRPTIAPAEKYEHQGNGENAELYPVFPFRCFGCALGTKDLVDWTMRHRTCKDTFGGICWTQDQIGWALAGNAQEAAKGLVRRFRTATDTLRFPIYGNHTTDGIPDWDHLGSGSIALQRMLVQEGDGKIYLLPAWPAEWDVDFKLHLQGGTVLSGSVQDGKLTRWDITPVTRKADVVVCEPARPETSANHADTAAAISSGLLQVKILDDGALAMTDLRTRQTWRQARVDGDTACRQRVVAVDQATRRITLDCGMVGTARDGKQAVAPFRLSLKLHPTRPDVEVSFASSGNGQWRQAAYPYVFVRDGAEVYNLYPHGEGMLVPVRRSHPDWLELPGYDLYGGVHSYLMCLGLVDLSNGQGLLTLLPDIESTCLRWREVGDVVAPQIVWRSNKGAFDRPYHVTWSFCDQGGYVAMSQRYRQFFADLGLHRTLREKAEAIPAVKNLAGAPVFWAIAHSAAEGREMADRLKRNGVDRCLFAMAVQDAPQAGYAKREELAEAIRHVRSLGYEVYRYDQYRDAFRKGSSKYPGFQLNTEAWPDGIVRQENWKMVQAFGPDSGVVCSKFFRPLAQKVFDQEFRDYDYSARFLDCLGSVGFNFEAECYAAEHPCTIDDTRRERIALLAELNRRGKLAGTECGLDYLIPHIHWFEGATTLVCWAESMPSSPGDVVHDINSRADAKTAAKEQYRRLFKLPLDAPAPDTISLSLKYRIPFYSLCHHDEAIVTWRWEDGMDQPPVHWRRKNLWSVLYGAPPMYRMFSAGQDKWHQQIGQTHRYVSDWVRQIAFDAMTSHRLLTPDRTVQETEFASGRGAVVNFGDKDYTQTDGQRVKPMDYVIFHRDGDRRTYTPPPCPNVVDTKTSAKP